MRKYAAALIGLAMTFGLATGAAAQGDGDLALLTGGTQVPPNVMLIFDTSLSMRNYIYHDDFDASVFHDQNALTPGCWRKPVNTGSWVKFAPDAVAGSDGQCPGSGDPAGLDQCPDNEDHFEILDSQAGHYLACPLASFAYPCAGMPSTECYVSGSWVYITIADVEGTFEESWFSNNYAHWWALQLMNAGSQGFGPIPKQTRRQGAKEAVDILVDSINPDNASGGYDETVRFGLARFDLENGGYVVEPIAKGNKTTLLTTLANMKLGIYTPLSESLVDIGRYFVGEHQNLGDYSQYDRSTADGSITAGPPLSPMDPTLTCQKNFVILLTDGIPTKDLNDHHGTAFGTTIGDWDGDGNDGTIGPLDATDWLDDVAAYLYNTDLVDDAIAPGVQNVSTYTVGFTIDLPILKDAAANGGGDYYTTSNASVLAAQLKDAIQDIITRSSSFTAASVPSSRTSFGDGFYTAFFQPSASDAFWAGHLEAYRIGNNFEILGKNNQVAIDPLTGLFVDPRIPIWDTGHKLAGTNGEPAHPPRNLFTSGVGVAGGALARKTFDAPSVTATEMGIATGDLPLYAGGPYATTEALADALVNYVRGEDAFDDDANGNLTETRIAVLGDIFHSNPTVVGTPPPFLLQEEGFGPPGDPNSFFGRYALRDRRLFVGANDGMLHAIKAGKFEFGDNPGSTEIENGYYDLEESGNGFSGGEEAFGYVPSFLLPKLKEIPLQTLNNKSFFVDGSPSVADAWLEGSMNDITKEPNEWATVAVTGMRRGGNGYLGLDVSDPKGVSRPYPNLLWEFNDPNEPLGESWSRPVMARVRVRGGPGGDYCDAGTLPPPDCKERWVAIFAGGYTETGDAVLPSFIDDPNDSAWEPHGKAIFIVDVQTGAVLSKLEYDPNDNQLSKMTAALPMNPAVLDINFDGFVDLIYVGDTIGQLWKWDLSEIGVVNTGTGLIDNWPAGVFFEAPVSPNSHYRSLFQPPVASFIDGRLVLAFGTGERTDLHLSHAAGDENRFYVIDDPDPVGPTSIPSAPYDESNLSQLNGQAQDPITTDLGFYLVADPDEKFVTNHLAFAGFVITASFQPNTGSFIDPCSAAQGQAFLYIFSLDEGGGFFQDDGSGPDSTRRLALGSGVPTDPRITTSATGGNRVFITTSDGAVTSTDGPPSGLEPVGLVFWRQQL
jgi:type IV pilus assembly protein PilY1